MLDAPFIVILDANVLFPQYVRHLMLYLPHTGLVQLKWTEEILDEAMRALANRRPDIPPERIAQMRAKINGAHPDALVSGYEQLIEALTLPDGNDRHVLAAAITCSAQVIVTNNLEDFPDAFLSPFAIEAQNPDDFLLHLVDLQPESVWWCLERLAADTNRPPLSAWDLLKVLSNNGMTLASQALRAWADTNIA